MTVNVVSTAFVTNPTLQGGGPVWTALRLLRAADRVDPGEYTFTVVVIDRTLRSLEDESLQRPLATLPKFAGLPLASYVAPMMSYSLRLRRVVRSLQPSGPVLIHAHDVISAYVARLVAPTVPRLLTIHTVGSWVTAGFLQLRPHLRGSLTERLMRYIERSAVSHARAVAFPAKGAAALFEREYPGSLDAQNVRIVHTGIEPVPASVVANNHSVLAEYGLEGDHLLLCISPHRREKGLDVLIEAIGRLPAEVRRSLGLLIVGRGPGKPEAEALIERLGLSSNVKLIEHVPEVAPLLRAADLFVLAPRETVFDLVLLEAMAAKVPVIATELGGNLEMFGKDSALLVPPGDSLAVRDAIVQLLDDPPLRLSLAESAYHRFEQKFTLEKMLEGYVSVYESLCGVRQRRN